MVLYEIQTLQVHSFICCSYKLYWQYIAWEEETAEAVRVRRQGRPPTAVARSSSML